MGFSSICRGAEADDLLLTSTSKKIPKDSFHLAYIVYFTLRAGFLLPWNAFMTAIDYFSYIYPDTSIDRVFAIVDMLVSMIFLVLNIGWAHKSSAFIRINVGLALFVVSFLIIPIMDVVYVKGRVGLYSGYYATVAVVALSGVADALVRGGVFGAAGELPNRYMQATCAGTAASGILVSIMRIVTKAIYPQDVNGLRISANLYFAAMNEETIEKGSLTGSAWRSTLWGIGALFSRTGIQYFSLPAAMCSISWGFRKLWYTRTSCCIEKSPSLVSALPSHEHVDVSAIFFPRVGFFLSFSNE